VFSKFEVRVFDGIFVPGKSDHLDNFRQYIYAGRAGPFRYFFASIFVPGEKENLHLILCLCFFSYLIRHLHVLV
jgi:hypothetical protein